MKPFYLVQSNYKGQPFIHEMDLDGTTREQLIDQLAQGQFDTGTLERILMVDLSTGTSFDISREVADALTGLSRTKRDELPDHVYAFVTDFGFEPYVAPEEGGLLLCIHPQAYQHAA